MSGGLWSLWKDDVYNPYNLVVVKAYTRLIACQVDYLISFISFFFVYAPVQQGEKDDFWLEVSSFVNCILLTIIILGYFNEISSNSDKFGGFSLLYLEL